jgi:hypothetical protein
MYWDETFTFPLGDACANVPFDGSASFTLKAWAIDNEDCYAEGDVQYGSYAARFRVCSPDGVYYKARLTAITEALGRFATPIYGVDGAVLWIDGVRKSQIQADQDRVWCETEAHVDAGDGSCVTGHLDYGEHIIKFAASTVDGWQNFAEMFWALTMTFYCTDVEPDCDGETPGITGEPELDIEEPPDPEGDGDGDGTGDGDDGGGPGEPGPPPGGDGPSGDEYGLCLCGYRITNLLLTNVAWPDPEVCTHNDGANDYDLRWNLDEMNLDYNLVWDLSLFQFVQNLGTLGDLDDPGIFIGRRTDVDDPNNAVHSMYLYKVTAELTCRDTGGPCSPVVEYSAKESEPISIGIGWFVQVKTTNDIDPPAIVLGAATFWNMQAVWWQENAEHVCGALPTLSMTSIFGAFNYCGTLADVATCDMSVRGFLDGDCP